jgi:hypothetical protein
MLERQACLLDGVALADPPHDQVDEAIGDAVARLDVAGELAAEKLGNRQLLVAGVDDKAVDGCKVGSSGCSPPLAKSRSRRARKSGVVIT